MTNSVFCYDYFQIYTEQEKSYEEQKNSCYAATWTPPQSSIVIISGLSCVIHLSAHWCISLLIIPDIISFHA